MSNANFIELETCIKHCVDYCRSDKGQKHDFVGIYGPRLDYAKERFEEGIQVSDAKYLVWQSAVAEETKAWKKTALMFKQLQRELSLMGKTDFLNQQILYWDVEILRDAVEELSAYSEKIEDVKESNDTLKRALNNAIAKAKITSEKVVDYSRFSRMRSQALGTLNATLGDFRKSMRRSLGKDSNEYNSIRWPMTLAPDERVF